MEIQIILRNCWMETVSFFRDFSHFKGFSYDILLLTVRRVIFDSTITISNTVCLICLIFAKRQYLTSLQRLKENFLINMEMKSALRSFLKLMMLFSGIAPFLKKKKHLIGFPHFTDGCYAPDDSNSRFS